MKINEYQVDKFRIQDSSGMKIDISKKDLKEIVRYAFEFALSIYDWNEIQPPNKIEK